MDDAGRVVDRTGHRRPGRRRSPSGDQRPEVPAHLEQCFVARRGQQDGRPSAERSQGLRSRYRRRRRA